MSVALEILVSGSDITDHVLVDSLNFESQMAAVPGTFEFKVKDTTRIEDFITGNNVQIKADGVPLFGGYLFQVVRGFAFPAVDTTDVLKVTARQFTVRGLDYNTLFDKRVLRNTANYRRHIPAYGPAPKTDKQYIENYLPGFFDGFPLIGQIDAVRTYDASNANPAGITSKEQGTLMRDVFDDLARWGALYYIDATRALQYLSVESLLAPWGFSDKPDKLPIPIGYATTPTYGMREFESTEDGSFIVNDAIVWGGSEWSNGLVYRRKEDATSEAVHGRWQVAELHFGEQGFGIQAGVDQRANVIITGKLDGGTYGAANRGFALPQFQVRCTWFDKDIPVDPNTGLKAYIKPGQLVTFKLYVFGNPYTLLLPARSIRVSSPTLDPQGNAHLKFEGFFGVQASDPWWLWKFLRHRNSNAAAQHAMAVESVTDSSGAGPVDYGAYATLTPIEVPDGVITTFTLPHGYGYIAGTTIVYLNGLAQRLIIDYTESDSTAGTITFTSAPVATDKIVIVCRTISAPGAGTVLVVNSTASLATINAAILNMNYDVIQIADTGNCTWDNVTCSANRASRPLTIEPVPGATIRFVGNGTTGDGIWSIGRSSQASYITLDGGTGAFIFDGVALAAAGVIGINGSDHCTVRNLSFQNITRDPAFNGSPHFSTPYKSWLFYITSETGRANTDLLVENIVGLAPPSPRDLSGIQIYNGTMMNRNITFRNITLNSLYYPLFIGESVTNLYLDSWAYTNCGSGSYAARISNGLGSVFASGSYSNMVQTSSDPKLFNYTGGGVMADTGGNNI